MSGRNFWMWAAAALLCTTLTASYTALHFYNAAEVQRRNYESLLRDLEDLTIFVDLKIDYGNGTAVWYNGTRLPLNATLLTATRRVASVDYSVSDFGAFVKEIDGVGGDPNRFWIWHYLDPETGEWVLGPVGSDRWVLHNGDVVSWNYSAF
ncbi:MAG: hypothetical protein ACE5OO_01740 [Candidatus Bathyarchaeia archaeon]